MWQVIGQDRAVSFLKRSLERGSIAHAYLMVGPPRVGKMTLALNLAQALNCEADEPPCGVCSSCQKIASDKHADVRIIGLNSGSDPAEAKSRTEIGIGQIREAQHSSSLPPFEGRYKVFIIDRAELLSGEAANCLLKTLEEPARGVIFVLLANTSQSLLATVVSRCQQLELRPVATPQIETALGERWGIEPPRAELLARLCHGCPGWALAAAADDSLLQQRAERIERLFDIATGDYEERFDYATQLAALFSQSRDLVQEILDLWLDWWHDLLLVKLGYDDTIINVDRGAMLADTARGYTLAGIRGFIKSIQMVEKQLRQNANPRLVLEVLMLSIPQRTEEVSCG